MGGGGCQEYSKKNAFYTQPDRLQDQQGSLRVKHASAGKEKKGGSKEGGGLDNIREDMKEYKMTEDMAQNRSV